MGERQEGCLEGEAKMEVEQTSKFAYAYLTRSVLQRVQGFFGEESKRVAWRKKTTNMEGSTTPIVYAPFVVGMAGRIVRCAFGRYVFSLVVIAAPHPLSPFLTREAETMR